MDAVVAGFSDLEPSVRNSSHSAVCSMFSRVILVEMDLVGAIGPDTLMNSCTGLNSAHRSVLQPS